jgi:hypothetical protein
MHIIDVGMQHYTHIPRFTAVTLRTLTEINENCFCLLSRRYSLSQNIVKSHVSNYLNIKKINTKFTCNSLQFVSKN